MMISKSETEIFDFYDSEKKLRTLLKVEREVKKPVQKDSKSLKIFKRGNSICFYGNVRVKDKTISHPLGAWKRSKGHDGITREEAIANWVPIEKWVKENRRHPKFYSSNQKKSDQTFNELIWEWWRDEYRDNLKKGDSSKTRENRLKKLVREFGDTPINDFEIDSGGRKLVGNSFNSLWVERGCEASGVINRRILNNFFKWCEIRRDIGGNQNPCLQPFKWEQRASKKSKHQPSRASTIKDGSWGDVPLFVESFKNSTHRTTGREVGIDPVVKTAGLLHLFAAIRTGVIVRLKWEWFNAKEDYWVIPAPTIGLKREGIELTNYGIDPTLYELDHIIPNTPEIQQITNHMKKLNENKEYVFHSPFDRKDEPHITTESLSKHFNEGLGWGGLQTPQGWRSVITTATKEFGDHINPEVMDRQMDHFAKHTKGSIGYYDRSTLLPKRREFMKWWSKTLVNKLEIDLTAILGSSPL